MTFCQGPFVAPIIHYNVKDAHGHVIPDDCEIIVKYPLPLLLEHDLNNVIGEVVYGFKKDDKYYVIFNSDTCFNQDSLSLGGEAIIEDNVIKKLFLYEVSVVSRPAQNVDKIEYVIKSKKVKNKVYLDMQVQKQEAELQSMLDRLSSDLAALTERVLALEEFRIKVEQKLEEMSTRLVALETSASGQQTQQELENVVKSINSLVSDLLPIAKQLLKQ